MMNFLTQHTPLLWCHIPCWKPLEAVLARPRHVQAGCVHHVDIIRSMPVVKRSHVSLPKRSRHRPQPGPAQHQRTRRAPSTRCPARRSRRSLTAAAASAGAPRCCPTTSRRRGPPWRSSRGRAAGGRSLAAAAAAARPFPNSRCALFETPCAQHFHEAQGRCPGAIWSARGEGLQARVSTLMRLHVAVRQDGDLLPH